MKRDTLSSVNQRNTFIYCTLYSFGFIILPPLTKRWGPAGKKEIGEMKRQSITPAELQTGSSVCVGGGEDEGGASQLVSSTAGCSGLDPQSCAVGFFFWICFSRKNPQMPSLGKGGAHGSLSIRKGLAFSHFSKRFS